MSDKIFVSCFHVPNTFDFQTIYSSQIPMKNHELSWKLISSINAMFFNFINLFYESSIWCLICTFTKFYCQYHFTTKPFLPLFSGHGAINRVKSSYLQITLNSHLILQVYERLFTFQTKPKSKFNSFIPLFQWTKRRELTILWVARTHLIDLAWRDRIAHGWNFEIASLPGQSPYDRSSWSWKQWQGPVARSSTHRQWHTRTLLFFPTHLLACWSIK